MKSANNSALGGAVFAFVVLLTPADALAADGNNSNTAAAHEHLKSGLQLADKGDWEQALVQFEEAHHLDPQPTTLYDVAQARLKTGRYRAAIEAYRALLVAKSSLSANQLATAQRQLAVAEGRVCKLTIVPRSTQADDEITVDDQVVTRFPILLDPGSHVARLRRAGNVVGERRIDLTEAATVSVDLEPAPAPVTQAPEKEKAGEEKPSKVPAWMVLGSSAAVLSLGGFFSIRGYGEWSDLDKTCGTSKTCRESDVDAAQRDVLIGDVGVGVGLVGVAIGVVMLVRSSSSTSAAQTSISGYPLRW